jgi:hypothetical protein
VDRSQISFVKFILEAYDNMAVVSTLDPRQALVQVVIAPGCETMVEGVMTGLGGAVEVATVGGAETDGCAEDYYRRPAGKNG